MPPREPRRAERGFQGGGLSPGTWASVAPPAEAWMVLGEHRGADRTGPPVPLRELLAEGAGQNLKLEPRWL